MGKVALARHPSAGQCVAIRDLSMCAQTTAGEAASRSPAHFQGLQEVEWVGGSSWKPSQSMCGFNHGAPRITTEKRVHTERTKHRREESPSPARLRMESGPLGPPGLP